MNGWTLDESEKINASAVNRFDNISEEKQAKIRRAVYKLRIMEDLMKKFKLAKNVKVISKKLGYEYKGKGELLDDCKWITRELTKIKLNRSIRGYGQPFNTFPIHVK